jgi:hypothetical protein
MQGLFITVVEKVEATIVEEVEANSRPTWFYF